MKSHTSHLFERFGFGSRYRFDPPVETNCVPLNNCYDQQRKKFSIGYCLRLEQDKKGDYVYVFQGRPDGSSVDHLFFVRHGADCKAHRIPRPNLHIVR